MTKNRDYTGLVRTPSSMAWLIGQRSRLKGQLTKQQKLLGELPRSICDLEAQLASLDAVIPLHEVKVDPSAIKGVRPRSESLLRYGQMTQGILECLRIANGSQVLTTEIALYTARRDGLQITNGGEKARLVKRVGKRLGTLALTGLLARHHNTAMGSTDEGIWSLLPDEQILPILLKRA